MSTTPMAEAFPAGEFLAEELEARGWSQQDFAAVLDRPVQFVSEVITGKREITRESAAQIGAALDTSAELWLNLQDTYLLWLQSQDTQVQESIDSVRTRARLQELAPVRELQKRGLVSTGDTAEQVRDVLDLLGMRSLDDTSALAFSARRSNTDDTVTPVQRAWVACVHRVAENLPAREYNRDAFEVAVRTLSSAAREPSALATFQALFAEAGVRLVYLEAFPGGKLDGCALLLDGAPAIGVSGRGKRLDKVLFTILHEAAHVLLGHLSGTNDAIADDLSAPGEDKWEQEADALAGSLAIAGPLPEVPGRITRRWVDMAAKHLDVHPIVLIGRLQNEGHIPWQSTLVREAPSAVPHLRQWKVPLPITHSAST
ncbi:helix-turn-helix domain-containing protein [Corynebacterium sp.]|uniref:helix-turn-helix domain-containing protein n=1 Tax=Corynebacterium sp. TaxID=1720 RepID=UPI0026DF15A3|nr:helix-turn-helix domain-containing protein [Corynebacterium sp.]MDO5511456.1 ImmA/IrrE family metallo-endopeptidase [Corynebacterium sp.]